MIGTALATVPGDSLNTEKVQLQGHPGQSQMHGHGKLHRLPLLGDPRVMFYKHLLRAYHLPGIALKVGGKKQTNRA